MKILIMRLGAIGDVIMTTPLVQAIKEKSDQFRIDYLVGKSYAKVLETNPHIKQLISIDETIFHNGDSLAILRWAHKLRKKHYDLIITLDKHYLFSVFSWLLKSPNRYGFSRGNNSRLTNIVPFDGSNHEMWYYNELGKRLGVLTMGIKPNVYPSKKDKESAKYFLKRNGPKLVGLAPGGCINKGQRLLQKRWPKHHYKTLIALLKMEGITPVLFGDRNDIHYNQQFKDCINLTGCLSIQRSSAMMGICPVIVAHDSGPLHIASTTDSHIIALFGPTPFFRFGPKYNSTILYCQIDKSLDCTPCYNQRGQFKKCDHIDCMEMLTPYEVMKVIKEKFK